MHEQDIIFFDFEASGLSSGSWPIEIGLSSICARQVETWSSLIRPRKDWAMTSWSMDSAAVHGISLSDLMTAATADEVAREVLTRIEGRTLVCDAPDFDAKWLAQLLQGQRLGNITVADFDYAAAIRFDEATLDWVYEGLERRKTPHRAGPDSARLAGAWLDGVKRQPAKK